MFLNIRHRDKPIKGSIYLPGDKSIAQRAIILSAIAEPQRSPDNFGADGKSTIRNIPLSDDCRATINCIRQLGIRIKLKGTTAIVYGKGLHGLQKPDKPLNVSESGTAARLLTGFLAGQSFPSVITGKKTLLTRPMERVIGPLRKMGARIESKDGKLPLYIYPSHAKGGSAEGTGQQERTASEKLNSIKYTMPVASAQVKSAILLAGLYAKGETVIYEPIPTRDHTERLLNLFTTKALRTQRRKITLYLSGKSLKPVNIEIPGDFSSAAYFIAAGLLIPHSKIIIKNVGLNPYRIGLLSILKRMGANLSRITHHASRIPNTEPIGDISVSYSNLRGIKISGNIIPSMIDEIPILALIATQAKGITVINGAGELRVKESDRLKAIVQELSKLGADIKETPARPGVRSGGNDGLIIKGPTKLFGGTCSSHNDHRIAMMSAIAGLIAEGKTKIGDVAVINKSFPSFYTFLRYRKI
ncbi:MAG: 3-phosphoshikimate 1-carboxyvinyltransferase [Planctomycetota bacterium]